MKYEVKYTSRDNQCLSYTCSADSEEEAKDATIKFIESQGWGHYLYIFNSIKLLNSE